MIRLPSSVEDALTRLSCLLLGHRYLASFPTSLWPSIRCGRCGRRLGL